jgi:CBS domain-containing protein
MKVKDVMTQDAACCSAAANVGHAVELMWLRNCGMLPVVGADRKLIGVVTDRDICVAMGTRNRLPGELNVGEIATQKVFTCKPSDELLEALHTMADNHVRRLPVVDDEGVPQGVLSMDDVIVHGDLNKRKGSSDLPSDEIIRSLKTLFGQKLPLVQTKSAAV